MTLYQAAQIIISKYGTFQIDIGTSSSGFLILVVLQEIYTQEAPQCSEVMSPDVNTTQSQCLKSITNSFEATASFLNRSKEQNKKFEWR